MYKTNPPTTIILFTVAGIIQANFWINYPSGVLGSPQRFENYFKKFPRCSAKRQEVQVVHNLSVW